MGLGTNKESSLWFALVLMKRDEDLPENLSLQKSFTREMSYVFTGGYLGEILGN